HRLGVYLPAESSPLSCFLFFVFFSRDQVFRINVRNGDEISRLSQLVNSDNLKLNVWKSPSTFSRPVDILVPSISLQPVKSFLKSQGLEYSVTIEDLQALLDNEDEEMQHNEGQERSSNNFNYGAYHSLEAIYHEMDSIARDVPDLASRVKIGHSFENRPMYVLKAPGPLCPEPSPQTLKKAAF
uniref:Peptidase M14 domain-containing protein n=1 Tax=Ursus maritimus TaxID=29073 RepID=A0A452TW80_URSMA